MATDMNLTIEHPDYMATRPSRIEARDLYEGREAVRAKSAAYLFKEKNETDEDYQIRLKRATLDPFVKRIISARQAVLFRKEHKRELPPTLTPYIQDVDRKEHDAASFFSSVAEDAQIDGICWVLIDMPVMPADEEGQPLLRSKRDEKQSGLRPFFQKLPAASVIDWEAGEDLRLNWAVIQESVNDSRQPGHAIETRERWKVWTRSQWSVYELNTQEDGAADRQPASYRIAEEGANPVGEVPLIPFFGIKRTDFSGWPVAYDVLGHVIKIYNKDSDLDWFERLAAHPIPVVISPRKPEKLDSGKGLWIPAIDDNDRPFSGKVDVKYLETNGNGFNSLRQSITDLRVQIIYLALAQAKKDSAQVQSADAQKEDRKAFNSSLKTASRLFEMSERACWRLMALWIRSDGSSIEIEYNRDFDDSVIDCQMINALKELVVSENLPLETLWEILVKGEILPPGFDPEEAQRLIEADIARKSGVSASHPGEDEDMVDADPNSGQATG